MVLSRRALRKKRCWNRGKVSQRGRREEDERRDEGRLTTKGALGWLRIGWEDSISEWIEARSESVSRSRLQKDERKRRDERILCDDEESPLPRCCKGKETRVSSSLGALGSNERISPEVVVASLYCQPCSSFLRVSNRREGFRRREMNDVARDRGELLHQANDHGDG